MWTFSVDMTRGFFNQMAIVIRSKRRLVAVALVMLLSANTSFADESLSVHTQTSKRFVTDVAVDVGFTPVREEANWTYVRFTNPTIPVWVSSDYLSSEAGVATVLANSLNVRLGPSLDSPILAVVNRGYSSKVLAEQSEFTQIYAPQWLVFAIRGSAQSRPIAGTQGHKSDQHQVASSWRTQVAPGDIPDTSAAPVTTAEISTPSTGSEQGSSDTDVAEDRDASSAELTAVVADEAVSLEAQQHRLAPGDTISLRVFGEEDLSVSNLRIPQSGSVSFPLIGSYTVAGKTLNTLETELQRVLAQGYVRNPRLSVTIDSYRPIFVLGSAQRIGSHPYSEGLTIAKAIAIAGGAKTTAKPDGVSLVRDGEIVHENVSINSQLRVLSGDIISIDEQEGLNGEGSAYIYLHGEVRSPGEYAYRRGLTVEKAIVLAGGFTLRASRRKISVSRIEAGEEEPTKLKRVKLHMPIKPGDIIDVGASWL